MIERNGVLREYMEVEEEGRGSSRAGAAGQGSSSRTEWWPAPEAAGSGHGWRQWRVRVSGRWSTAAGPQAGDHLAFLCASPCHSCAPPTGKRHGRAMLVVPVSGSTTRPPRACPGSGAHPRSCEATNENG
jgi:hypothetical protein